MFVFEIPPKKLTFARFFNRIYKIKVLKIILALIICVLQYFLEIYIGPIAKQKILVWQEKTICLKYNLAKIFVT